MQKCVLLLVVSVASICVPRCEATGSGKSIFFDNTGTHKYQVRTQDISGLESQFTIGLWAKIQRPGDSASENFAGFSGTIFSFVDEADTENYFQFAEYDVMVLLVGSEDIIDVYQNGDDVDWHHYAFAYNDTSGILEFYRDGARLWTSEHASFAAAHTGFMQTGHFLLGKSHTSSDSPFTGFLDEFCVWNTTLSNATINLIRTRGCLTNEYSHDSLVTRLGFDKDRPGTLPDVWDDVTGSYSTSTAPETTCASDLQSGDYPMHVISTAPFESDETAQWTVVTRTSGASIDLLCRECSQVTILSLPTSGQLKTVIGDVLGVGNITTPTIMYDPDGTNVDMDSFSFVHSGSINATVMLQTNSPTHVQDYTMIVSQNSFLVESIPTNGMSTDVDTGPPVSAWILSVSVVSFNSSTVTLYQFNNTDACDLDNWDFYQCVAVDSNLIPIYNNMTRVMITDPFNRIAIMHEGLEYGSAVMSIEYQVFDGSQFSNISTVTVDVEKLNRGPVPGRGQTFSTLEDTLLTMTLPATDAEGDDILVIITDLPAHGQLFQVDNQGNLGRALTSDSASSTIDQWAASAIASSEWSNPIDYADQIVGAANVFPNHGDLAGAWQPLQSGDYVHSWIEINITTPVYISSIHVYETWHPGSVARVSVYVEELQEWKVLWEGESQVPLLNPDPTATKAAITTVDLCPSIYKVSWIHFDLDLSSSEYWAGWDAVKVTGSVLQKSQILLSPTRQVAYLPTHNYNGPDSCAFTVIDCPFFLKYRTLDPDDSRTAVIGINVVPVNDPPVAELVEVSLFDGPSSSINVTLVATDVDDTELTFSVSQLPRSGEVFNELGEKVTTVPTRLPGESRVITFKPAKLTSHSKHAETVLIGFSVTDAHDASSSNYVRVAVQSCIFSNYTYTVGSTCDFSTLQRSLTFNWSEHTECIDYDFGLSTVDCDHIDADSSVGVVVLVITCLTAAACVFWMVWLFRNQGLPIVRASQFLFCFLFVMGACTLCVSNLVFLGPNSDFLCMGRPWLFHVSFTWMFGPLTMKIWRAYQILQNSAFKRKLVSNAELLKWLSVMSLVDFFLLALFTGVAPLQSSVQSTNTVVGPIAEHMCRGSSGSNVFIILLATYKVLMCVAACFWSFQTRNVNQQFAESKHIMFAVYNTGVVGGIVSFVIYAAGIGGASAMLLHSFGVCISVLASISVVLVPKFLARALTTQDLLATNASVNQASIRRMSHQHQQMSLATTTKQVGDTSKTSIGDVVRQGPHDPMARQTTTATTAAVVLVET